MNSPDIDLPAHILTWEREEVKYYFESKCQEYNLPHEYIVSLYDEDVNGMDFPFLTEGELVTSYGFPRAIASRFGKAITAVLTLQGKDSSLQYKYLVLMVISSRKPKRKWHCLVVS